MKTLAVIANCGKPRAAEVLSRLAAKAKTLGLVLKADPETASLLPAATISTVTEMRQTCDAVVALGGDGTVLRAVRELDGADKPVLGVNIGSLGFLTSVAQEDLERALDCLVQGDYSTSMRTVAECVVRRPRESLRYRALNDIVITTGGSSRVVSLDLAVDEENVTSFVCDGLIVSTPTGSTGHSLSAGGPIVLPGSAVFVVTLICAHTLSTRPLVVPEQSRISITVTGGSGAMQLSVDGQVGNPLGPSDTVSVARSAQGVRFVHLPGHSYFSLLRQKLHWRGSNV